jgi:hypothetical protein
MMAAATVSWRACASSLVVVVLGIGLTSCGSATRDKTKSRSSSTQPAPRVLKRLSRIQRRKFALLRTRPEGLPARARRLGIVTEAAMNPTLAQRLPLALPGSYWLVPGIGYLCIVSEVPGTPGIVTVCARTEQVIRQGFGTISLTPIGQVHDGMPTRLLVGIAPDDACTAFVYTRGTVAAVPVVNGVFVLRDSIRAPSDFTELRRRHGACGATKSPGTA